jgi:hypothetical protein
MVTERQIMTTTATYDPCDNKLRVRNTEDGEAVRFDEETYRRLKAAGFSWAPQQKLWVAPMWTPEREDLACELADSGELEDEDTSLTERAEERAERFETYQEKRAADAERTHEYAEGMAEDLAPAGGVIGRGNWRAARKAHKDAERLKSLQAKAVKLWETSEYWERRAKGAIKHARYKELPGVRARRVKGLEADQRKHLREMEEQAKWLRLWQALPEGPAEEGKPTPALRQAMGIANYSRCGFWSDLDRGTKTANEVQADELQRLPGVLAHHVRWLAHIERRLAYERTLLAADGYVEPVRTRVKRDLGPIVNWPAPDHIAMTKAEMQARYHVLSRFGGPGRHATAGQPRYRQYTTNRSGTYADIPIYLTDVKRKDPPTAAAPSAEEAAE